MFKNVIQEISLRDFKKVCGLFIEYFFSVDSEEKKEKLKLIVKKAALRYNKGITEGQANVLMGSVLFNTVLEKDFLWENYFGSLSVEESKSLIYLVVKTLVDEKGFYFDDTMKKFVKKASLETKISQERIELIIAYILLPNREKEYELVLGEDNKTA